MEGESYWDGGRKSRGVEDMGTGKPITLLLNLGRDAGETRESLFSILAKHTR